MWENKLRQFKKVLLKKVEKLLNEKGNMQIDEELSNLKVKTQGKYANSPWQMQREGRGEKRKQEGNLTKFFNLSSLKNGRRKILRNEPIYKVGNTPQMNSILTATHSVQQGQHVFVATRQLVFVYIKPSLFQCPIKS